MRTTKTNKILSLVNSEKKEKSFYSDEFNAPSNPLIRVPDEDDIPEVFIKTTPGYQIVNVTFLLINEQIGQVMERFNCCTCPKCIAAVTAEVLKKAPAVTVEVRHKNDAYRVNLLIAQHKAEISRILTKAVINVKSLNNGTVHKD